MLNHVGHDIDHCVSMLVPRHCEDFLNCGHVSNVHINRSSHIQLLLSFTKKDDVHPVHLLSSPS